MSTPLSSSAAVTRQRSFGLALLASVPVVGIQEGSSAISIKEEGVVKAAVASAAASADDGSTLPDSLSQVSAGRPRRCQSRRETRRRRLHFLLCDANLLRC